jgi:hypothetical protein
MKIDIQPNFCSHGILLIIDDSNECGIAIAKSAGFHSPRQAVLRQKLSDIDAPRFAAGQFFGCERLKR